MLLLLFTSGYLTDYQNSQLTNACFMAALAILQLIPIAVLYLQKKLDTRTKAMEERQKVNTDAIAKIAAPRGPRASDVPRPDSHDLQAMPRASLEGHDDDPAPRL